MEKIALLGQAMIGLVFLLGSLTDVLEYKSLQQLLQRKNLRYDEYLLPGAIGLKALGGLGLIFNIYAAAAALLLAGFTIIANFIFHPFWMSSPADRKKEYFAFVVYLAVAGGLLVIVGR
jgi:uncharacterized membrane protein YphA (DoxX/SURF4 family)